MADVDRIRQLAGINEAPYGHYSQDEEILKKLISEIQTMAERIGFLSTEGGPLEKRITAIGGDVGYVADLRQVGEDLTRAIDEVDYGARGHQSAE